MIFFLYELLFRVIAVIFFPVFYFNRGKMSADIYWMKWGFLSAGRSSGGKRHNWIHASSLGEVTLARQFVLSASSPFAVSQWVLTVQTPAGYEAGLQFLPPEQVCYLPFDITSAINRFLCAFKPRKLYIVETEIWPQLLRTVCRRKIKVSFIHARLEESSLALRHIFGNSFKNLSRHLKIFPISDDYATNFSRLFPQAEIKVVPSMKWTLDESLKKHVPVAREKGNFAVICLGSFQLEEALQFFKFLATQMCHNNNSSKTAGPSVSAATDGSIMNCSGVDGGRKVNVLQPGACDHVNGSGNSRDLQNQFSSTSFLVALRHPLESNTRKLRSHLVELGFTVRCVDFPLEELNLSGGEVVLFSPLGYLKSLYSQSDLCIVGGGFLGNRGGQNPLEPLNFKKPVIFGPRMSHFQWCIPQLESLNIAQSLDLEQLPSVIMDFCCHPDHYTERGKSGYDLLKSMSGGVEKIWSTLNYEK